MLGMEKESNKASNYICPEGFTAPSHIQIRPSTHAHSLPPLSLDFLQDTKKILQLFCKTCSIHYILIILVTNVEKYNFYDIRGAFIKFLGYISITFLKYKAIS